MNLVFGMVFHFNTSSITFKKGFGFDTFTGLPEDWRGQPKGAYSSFGSIPKIAGARNGAL